MNWLDRFFLSKWPFVLLAVMALLVLQPKFACSVKIDQTPTTADKSPARDE